MTCVMCGELLHQKKTGRKRHFCSDSCRLHHHRASVGGRGRIDYTQNSKIIDGYRKAWLRFVAQRSHGQLSVLSLRGTRYGKTIDRRNRRPIALDLFCGGGGASVGLCMSGYDVVGVDIDPQPEYPFAFLQADATKPPVDLSGFDFVWASTMCQKHSTLNNALKQDYPCQLESIRDLLRAAGVPYVMENVPAAPLVDPVALTGDMFGLSIIRRRIFESNIDLVVPLHRPERGRVKSGECITVAGSCGGSRGRLKDRQEAMGIDWMKNSTLVQAVPPAYSWYLGKQVIDYVSCGYQYD